MALPQNYNAKDFEDKIYQQWIDAGVGNPEKQFEKQDLTDNTKTHSILMPPPNLSGNMHAGHSFQHFLMDTLSRLARQRGELDLWYPGVDHAGIQLEGVIDKLIKKGEFDEHINKYLSNNTKGNGVELELPQDRSEWPQFIKKNHNDLWLTLAWEKVNLWRNNQKNQAKVLGDTPDYSRQLFTLDDRANDMVYYAFKKYWEDGLIYKGAYLVNWSVGLQTALSDVSGEIEFETRTDPFVTFEYEAKELKIDNEKLKIKFQPLIENYLKPVTLWPRLRLSTVRPETKFTDLAVAMHPSKFEIYFNLDIFDTAKDGFDENLATEFFQNIQNYNIEVLYHLPALKSGDLKLIFSEKIDPNFGTGILKVTPAHDQFDYDLYKEFVEKGVLESGRIQTSINRDGKLAEVCGKYAGLTVEQGRLAVIKRLAETGYIPVKDEFATDAQNILNEVKNNLESEHFDPTELSYEEGQKRLQELLGEAGSKLQINWNYEHNVSLCERSKTVIEPLISEEFFLSYTNEVNKPSVSSSQLPYQGATSTVLPLDKGDTAKPRGFETTTLQKLGLEGISETTFFSEQYKEMAINFVQNIKDWCISRDLTWGHKFPVWYNLDLNPEKRFYSFKEIQENPELNRHFQIDPLMPEKYGNWVQEEKILDTWFSSCLWPLSTLDFVKTQQDIPLASNQVQLGLSPSDLGTRRGSNEAGGVLDFNRFYPTQEMTTAKEIFYLWIVRMIILGKYFTGTIPFETVIITPTILDDKGRKMSKSLGNGLDPVEAIEKFSSDSLRLAMLGGMIPNRNMKMGGALADNQMEKYRNFGNKIWNVARFLDL